MKYYINKLERILIEKYPNIKADFYISKRTKIIHLGVEKALHKFDNYSNFLKDMKKFYIRNIQKFDYEYVEPPQLINSVKWKFDYIIFRKK